MLKTKVKATSVTNLTDARYFAAWEVEWLGFNFDQASDSYISVQNMRAIKEWVDGVKTVGEFSALHTAEDMQQAAQLMQLDALQINMHTPADVLQALAPATLIKEIVVTPDTSEHELRQMFEQFADSTTYFLLNFHNNQISFDTLKKGTFLSLDFLTSTLMGRYDTLLHIDLNGNNVEEILDTFHPYGICVSGGTEEKVGFKSFDELDEIFEPLEIFV